MNRAVCAIFSCAGTLLTLSGCAATSYTRTGDYYNVKPRESYCNFTVYTATPAHSFKELGSIRFNPGPTHHTFTIEEVKETAREDVCQAGGNGLIVGSLGRDGYYETATVIWVDK